MTTTSIMPNHPLSLLSLQARALCFDVFGTVVDWRSSVETALLEALTRKVAPADLFSAVPLPVQSRAQQLTDADVASLAAAWRHSYGAFARGFVPGLTPCKDVDAHHRDCLATLLAAPERQLAGLLGARELKELSDACWHRLAPWPDSAEGLRRLGARFVTATLSSGNHSLLRDLDAFGGLGFARLLSAEDFGAYKPHPTVYLGACERLGGLDGDRVAMVAARLGDLAAAREVGMRTVYVERRGEEDWAPDEERYREAKGWVDDWVSEGEGGLLEVARRLGAH